MFSVKPSEHSVLILLWQILLLPCLVFSEVYTYSFYFILFFFNFMFVLQELSPVYSILCMYLFTYYGRPKCLKSPCFNSYKEI